MTLIAPTPVRSETTEPRVEPKRDRSSLWCALSLTVAGVAGAVALVAADRAAEWGRGRPFELFWLGMLVFTLPAAYWAGRRATASRLRLAVLIAYASFSYLPKLLRNPTGPLYHDEFAHWRQSRQILFDGRLFETNPIVRVIGDFPGLHSLVASVSSLTGFSVWHAALAVLIASHVLLVLGVAVLAQEIWRDGRIAAIAALIYGLNSSFLFFDTQFGYESLAITLWVWALVGVFRAVRSPRMAGLALLLTLATVVTHHLTALGLLATMLIIAVVLTVSRHPRAWVAWGLALGAAAMTTGWLLWVAPKTASYLDPYLGRALNQFAAMFADNGESGRTLFKQSIAPWWEQKTAFAAQICALVLVAAAAVNFWKQGFFKRGEREPAALAMLVLGACYFPAAVLILTPSGAEGARRSWAFSYLGIALVVAPLAVRLLDRWAAKAAVALLTVFAIVLVGNTAAGMNPSYRFPGPPVYGSDTRAMTPEVVAASQWLRATQGRDLRIVADRYSGLIFGSFGGQEPVTGSVTFPTYDVYLAQPGKPVSPQLIAQLSGWRFSYLVVDRRMAREVPEIQIYFENNEPIAHNGKPGFTIGQLAKFDRMPWTIKIYDSGDIAIYRFDFSVLK
ncbi:hypothetical protein GCM10010172_86990 [Paractinoplanes ferrugineus]|uniref:Uncharacterized protein n=1 Tax=Paractinoplanes ferrugineus TaxID=113564 RepID=A0A919J861_9ACTN|nr:hypothetical protein [Actinoplanes ferrugineus]GIE15087.1 hypothetical protein Afe05nite_69270 [Actinoplanes ferrugineus]